MQDTHAEIDQRTRSALYEHGGITDGLLLEVFQNDLTSAASLVIKK